MGRVSSCRSVLVLLAALSAAAAEARAQAQNDPCVRRGGNRVLPRQLRAGAVPRVRWSEETPWSWQALATSFRWPELEGPPRGESLEERLERAAWSCQYAGKQAWDGRPETAWCEGVAGEGIGETVLAFAEGEEVGILAGDAGSDSAFAASNRPRRVRVYLLRALEDWGNPMDGADWRRLRVLGRHVVTLADANEFQPLPLPAPRAVARRMDESETHFVAVEILSVYRGAEGRHTCISEIQ